MRKFTIITLALFGTLFLGSIALAHTPDFVELAAQLKPSVVNISTSKKVKVQHPNFQGRGGSQDLFEEFFKKHLELIFLRFNFDMIKEIIARVLLPGIREE